MCHACVIDGVRREMLSRRDLFRGAAAVGAASIAAGAISARPLLAQSSGTIVDLTHTYDETFPTFGAEPGIAYAPTVRFEEAGYQLYTLTLHEHTGTHVDAPLHFSADGASVDEIPVEQLICPLCIVDITLRAAEEPNAMVLPDDIERWISVHGEIPQGACVAMHSGWAAKVGELEYRNRPDGAYAFPGFSAAAANLLAEMGAAVIGVDTLSLDPGNSTDFAVHYAWLPTGRYGIENLANLDRLPASGATVFVGAPKHRGGTGGPARVIAIH